MARFPAGAAGGFSSPELTLCAESDLVFVPHPCHRSGTRKAPVIRQEIRRHGDIGEREELMGRKGQAETDEERRQTDREVTQELQRVPLRHRRLGSATESRF